eukprot:3216126-Prymnesium_polylepis.1
MVIVGKERPDEREDTQPEGHDRKRTSSTGTSTRPPSRWASPGASSVQVDRPCAGALRVPPGGA